MTYFFTNYTFPCLEYLSVVVHQNCIILEKWDHYQKRTFRNKYQICGPDGVITLSIPLVKGKHEKQNYIDTRIANTESWQRVHWRTFLANYGKSPYFEHYSEKIEPFFFKPYTWLFDYNLQVFQVILDLLGCNTQIRFTESYEIQPSGIDLRTNFPYHQLPASNPQYSYEQVFADRSPFIPNLSILDLLFCLGPECKILLKEIYNFRK